MKIHIHTMPGLAPRLGPTGHLPGHHVAGEERIAAQSALPARARSYATGCLAGPAELRHAATSAASARAPPSLITLPLRARLGSPKGPKHGPGRCSHIGPAHPSQQISAYRALTPRGGQMNTTSGPHVRTVHGARHPRSARDRRPPSRRHLGPYHCGWDASPAAPLFSGQLTHAFTATTGGRTDACTSPPL